MWHVAREVASNTTALQCSKRIFDTFMAFMSCQVVTTLPTCVEVMHVNLLSADTYRKARHLIRTPSNCNFFGLIRTSPHPKVNFLRQVRTGRRVFQRQSAAVSHSAKIVSNAAATITQLPHGMIAVYFRAAAM